MRETYESSTKLSDLIKLRDKIHKHRETFEVKWDKFTYALAEKGIQTARINMGEFEGCVSFTKQRDGKDVIIVGKDKKQLKRSWITKQGKKTVEISPLYMAEFGSGWFAVTDTHENVPSGAGQGTFPNQKHAFDPQGWTWTDEYGATHWSKGQEPTYPMYLAVQEMVQTIDEVAQKVFKV